MSKPNKFVITNDNEILLGRVDYHKDLLDYGETTCKGGGTFEIDNDKKEVILICEPGSTDFGLPHLEDVKNKPEFFEQYKFFVRRTVTDTEIKELNLV